MKYEEYDIDDFLRDEFFVLWVKNKDEDTVHFWDKWIQQHPQKKQLVFTAAEIIRSIKYKNTPCLDDKCYIETFENILLAEKNPPLPKQEEKKEGFLGFFKFRNIAAVFLLSLLAWLSFDIFLQENQVSTNDALEDQWVTRSVPPGKKSVVTLSDGTKVYINSNSELRFPKRFSDTLRTAYIKGEVFFEVEKEHRPFIVSSEGMSINVLGTSFNVRQMSDGKMSVALVTGKVRVQDDLGNQVNLNPNEMLVRKENGSLTISEFDPLEVFGWKNKQLVFNKDDFNTLKTKLENWYGVEITVVGKINPRWKYSGKYEDQMLEDVLKGIRHTSGISYSIKNKNVIISNIN